MMPRGHVAPPCGGRAICRRSSAATCPTGHENVLERDRPRDEVLLDHVLHQRLEARAVGLDAAGIGIAAEHLVELVDVLVQPRQHQRVAALEPRQREVLGVDEALVEPVGDRRVALVDVAADHHQMHHREDARRLGELALDRARVREQRRDVGMRDRVLRAHDDVDLALRPAARSASGPADRARS